MNLLIGLLTAIHVLVAVVLVVLVLMQKSSEQGIGAAFGGGVTETVFGGSVTPLVRMTIWCACILLATTLLLAVLHARHGGSSGRSSVVNKLQQTAPASPASADPGATVPSAMPITTKPAPPPAPVTPAPAPAPAPAP